MGIKVVKSEKEMKKWFEKHYSDLGYSEIIRRDIHTCPDFIMKKNGEIVGVELETLLSNFLLHKHDIKNVDEIVCVEKDIDLPIGVPIITIPALKFISRVRRISFTVDPETIERIKRLVKSGEFRNASHVVERAIKHLKEVEK